MKSINTKRIAAVVAGAALLGVGLAFAGPVTFQNVQIIGNSGQPLVQVVVAVAVVCAGVVAGAMLVVVEVEVVDVVDVVVEVVRSW